MLMELCKCQQTRRYRGRAGLRLRCCMLARNDVPKSTADATIVYIYSEVSRSENGKSSAEQPEQESILACFGYVDIIVELEFTGALAGLMKDTAPCPDKIKYSEIRNL